MTQTQTASRGNLPAKIDQQLGAWRESLIDTSRSQRLLYFRHLRVGSLEIDVTSFLGALHDLESGPLTLHAGKSDDGSAFPSTPEDGLLCPDVTAKAIQSAGAALTSKARDVSTGQGVWPLHLGLGMLRWADPDTRETADAPVLMIPVELRRDGVGRPWKVSRRDEEIQFNPALRLKLRELNLNLPGDDDVDSPIELLDRLRMSIPGDWEVRVRGVLANFSFPKLAMYSDLRENEESIKDHPLVQLLAAGPDAPSSREFPFEARPLSSLETYRPLRASMSILDADSSQRQCVAAALDGKSFVMDGPPGTGKSQTISNIIAELIAVGRSVLFVSEKAAALEVVESRLAAAGLEHMILNLHGERTRKEVARHLSETLSTRHRTSSTMSRSRMDTLSTSVEELTQFAEAMNEKRAPLDMSLISAIGEVDRRLGGHGIPSLSTPVDSSSFDEATLSRIELAATEYSTSQSGFSRLSEPVWTDLAKYPHSRAEVTHAAHNTGAAVEALGTVIGAVRTLDEDFDLSPAGSVDELGRRLELGTLMRSRREVPFDWFSMEADALESSVSDMFRLRSEFDEQTSGLDTELGTTWRSADAESLESALNTALADFDGEEMTAPLARDLASALDEAVGHWEELRSALTILAEAFEIQDRDLTPDVVVRLATLAEMADATARPPKSWFDPNRFPTIHEAITAVAAATNAVEKTRGEAEEHFSESILAEDISSLEQRFASHGGSFWSKAGRSDRKVLKQHSRAQKYVKDLVNQLPSAEAWKHAEQGLQTAALKAEHVLGFTPHTDHASLDSYLRAWEFAREAVSAAGLTVPLTAVGAQLASDGSALPTLIPAANAVGSHANAAREIISKASLDGHFPELTTSALSQSRDEAHRIARSLRSLATALDDTRSALGLTDPAHFDARRAQGLLTRIREVRETGDRLLRLSSDLQLDAQGSLEPDELALDISWVVSVRRALGRAPDQADVVALQHNPRFGPDIQDALKSYQASIDSFLDNFRDDRRDQLLAELAGPPTRCIDLLNQAATEAGQVIPLVDQLTGSRAIIDSVGLGPVADHCVRWNLDATSTANILVGALLDSWVDQIASQDQRLDRWRSSERNQLVANFAALDQQLVESAHSRLLRAYDDQVTGVGQTLGAQIITREAEKKSRHLPIRTLLDSAEDTIQLIKPCMMMSPLTVSHYVPSDMIFDVVIFDEASQVKPEDAVNCIYRGRQLIVAGDQKQLPPTAFFSTGDDEGGLDDTDDFESVLDLAKAAGLTGLPLTWHYRSRHESLIAFSNRRFYEGKLFTFPSATYEADDLGVSFIHAHGVYRRGTTRDNPVEATKVVERVRFFAEEFPDLSIGVVAMSEAQRTAIQDAMERVAPNSPAIAALLNSGTGIDDFFVKALENVQGDERDVIIMSIGYGPDENGKFTMNFGPLTKKGGWRRLNVAITRARRRLEVVASFDHSMLNPGTNETLAHLRHFLNYADNGPSVLAMDSEDSLGDAESVFEEQVQAQIASWGYEVVTQVGVAGYRIDMAVRHPNRPGTYAIGIECDGAAYHSSPTARDRDRLRQAVLEGLGWRLHRIWGLSWWRDRENQISALRSAIEEAVTDLDPVQELDATSTGGTAALDVHEMDFGDDHAEASENSPAESPDDGPRGNDSNGVVPGWVRPYEFADVTSDDPAERGIGAGLPDAFVAALLAEAPVSQERLLEIYKSATRAVRVSPSTRQWLFDELERDSRFHSDPRAFWHVTGRNVTAFRQPDEVRGRSAVMEISDAELRFAVVQLLFEDLVIEQELLVERITQLAGDGHVTRPARRIIEEVIEELRLDEAIFVDDDGFVHKP